MNDDRYSRQVLFAGLGKAGQERLLGSRVTVVGCGALGTSICNLLARAGVGRLRIVDRDFVEKNNHHFDGGKYFPLLERYFLLLHGGKHRKEAFDEVFAGKDKDLEKEWKKYVKELEPEKK